MKLYTEESWQNRLILCNRRVSDLYTPTRTFFKVEEVLPIVI